MRILTLSEAKTYLRIEIDDIEDDGDITALIDAAEKYLENAGCTLNEGDEVAKLAMKMLVVHWYENREPTGKTDKLVYGLQSLITQLKYCTESGGMI